MKRVLVLAAVTAVAAAIPLSGQNGNGLDAAVSRASSSAASGRRLRPAACRTSRSIRRIPSTWYVATAFGGLWKTTNRGITFTPIFDDGGSFTLCCVVVDPKDSNIVWVGSGENASQRSAHFGDGVYKSTDAGKTWKRRGPRDVGAHRQDPRSIRATRTSSTSPRRGRCGRPAASAGSTRRPTAARRGTRVLTISDDTGISDVVFDPKNPDIIYASSYQRRRAVGQMIGGGPEGGIFKSTNAGKTWTKLIEGAAEGRRRPHRARRRSAQSEARVRADQREGAARTRRFRVSVGVHRIESPAMPAAWTKRASIARTMPARRGRASAGTVPDAGRGRVDAGSGQRQGR